MGVEWGQAQAAVIGSGLIDAGCVPLILAELRPEDFTGAYLRFYEAFRDLTAEQAPIDPVIVLSRIGQEYRDTAKGIMDATPTSANVQAYIKACKEQSRLRLLRDLGEELAAAQTLDDARPLMQKAAELARYAGRPTEAAEWRNRAENLRRAIRECCLNEDGMLTDGPGRRELSQHTQVFGVLTGTLSREEGRRNLLRTMEEGGAAQCSVAMCFYLFRAMEETGLYECTDRYWEIWRRMVKNGCSTCVEAEHYARSECHAWGALALYELPTVTLGVRPAAPGYEKIEVRPQPGAFRSASGTVRTPPLST